MLWHKKKDYISAISRYFFHLWHEKTNYKMLFVNILSKFTSNFYGDIAVAIFCRWVVQYQLSVVQGLMSPAYWSVAPTGLGLFVGRGCATLHRLLNILRPYGAL